MSLRVQRPGGDKLFGEANNRLRYYTSGWYRLISCMGRYMKVSSGAHKNFSLGQMRCHRYATMLGILGEQQTKETSVQT